MSHDYPGHDVHTLSRGEVDVLDLNDDELARWVYEMDEARVRQWLRALIRRVRPLRRDERHGVQYCCRCGEVDLYLKTWEPLGQVVNISESEQRECRECGGRMVRP